jgi:hypothetical protein
MWIACPRILDMPVTIFGLDIDDFALVSVTPLLASLVWDAPGSFGCAAALAAVLYFSKRNRPAGDVFHTLHSLELLRLPGILGPRPHIYSPW